MYTDKQQRFFFFLISTVFCILQSMLRESSFTTGKFLSSSDQTDEGNQNWQSLKLMAELLLKTSKTPLSILVFCCIEHMKTRIHCFQSTTSLFTES